MLLRIFALFFRAALTVVIGVMVMITLVLFISPLIVFLPFALLILAQLVRWLSRHTRRRRAMMVLGYLDQAVRLNLPLGRMLDAAAQSERGILGYRLAHLRDRIAAGEPMQQAIRVAVPEMPPRAVAMVGFGEQIGRLPQLLSHLTRGYVRDQRDSDRPGRLAWLYTLNVLLFLGMITTAMMIFIMPKFEKIFEDFDANLPRVTRDVINVGVWMSGSKEGQTVPGAVMLALLLLAVVLLAVLSRTRFGAAAVEPILWRIPMLHGLQRDRGMADVCRTMAEAAACHVPLPTAVDHASHIRLNAVLRARMVAWSRRMIAGESPADAARGAKLPALAVGLLATTRGHDDLRDVFAFLARYYTARYSRMMILLQSAAQPAMVLGLAALVGWLALGMFMPLVGLIWKMAEDVWAF
jgi:type II secretory pathway component PulF